MRCLLPPHHLPTSLGAFRAMPSQNVAVTAPARHVARLLEHVLEIHRIQRVPTSRRDCTRRCASLVTGWRCRGNWYVASLRARLSTLVQNDAHDHRLQQCVTCINGTSLGHDELLCTSRDVVAWRRGTPCLLNVSNPPDQRCPISETLPRADLAFVEKQLFGHGRCSLQQPLNKPGVGVVHSCRCPHQRNADRGTNVDGEWPWESVHRWGPCLPSRGRTCLLLVLLCATLAVFPTGELDSECELCGRWRLSGSRGEVNNCLALHSPSPRLCHQVPRCRGASEPNLDPLWCLVGSGRTAEPR